MRGLNSLIFFFIVSLMVGSAFAESEYSKLREQLKRPDVPSTSYISGAAVEEAKPLSMREQQKVLDDECKRHRKSAKCLEYRRLARSRWLAEKVACEKNPIGKRCQSFHEYSFRKMVRRQAACRGGLDTRKCSLARAGAKSSGELERH